MASERGQVQTERRLVGSRPMPAWGCAACWGDPAKVPAWLVYGDENSLERLAEEGESPVLVVVRTGTTGSRVPRGKSSPVGSWGDHAPRLRYALRPIGNEYREGKVKSTPARGVK